jgi:outer membrane immunogenic protein
MLTCLEGLMKKFIVALAAVVALMTPAAAADMAVRAAPPPPPPVYNWTGFWISGGFGYGLFDVDHSVSDPVTGTAFDISHDNGGRGWLGKVGGGFDYEFAGPFLGNWLIGAFADYEWTGIRGNYGFNCPAGCFGPTGFVGTLKNDYTWAVGARLGWVVVPQLLTYVNGGWTQGHFKQVDFADASTGALTGLSLAANTQNGWFLGGGTEYAFNLIPGLFWKSEYRFSDFGNRTASNICAVGVAGSICGPTVLHSIDNTHAFEQTITTELVYRFNWGGAGVRW